MSKAQGRPVGELAVGVQGKLQSMHAVLARLVVRGTREAHAVKLDAAADAAVLDLAAAADSRLPLTRHGDFVNVIYNGFVVTRWRLTQRWFVYQHPQLTNNNKSTTTNSTPVESACALYMPRRTALCRPETSGARDMILHPQTGENVKY